MWGDGATWAQEPTPGIDEPSLRGASLNLAPTSTVATPRAAALNEPPVRIAPPAAPAAPEEVQVSHNEARMARAAGATEDEVESVPPELRAATRTQGPMLHDCRKEVALRPGAASPIVFGDLLLRFTIQTTGAISDPEVVALAPTDPAVMTCVRERLLTFRYDLPPPDEVRVAYKLPAP